MIAFVRSGLTETSGHIRHPFTNLIAFHNRFPFNALRQCRFKT